MTDHEVILFIIKTSTTTYSVSIWAKCITSNSSTHRHSEDGFKHYAKDELDCTGLIQFILRLIGNHQCFIITNQLCMTLFIRNSIWRTKIKESQNYQCLNLYLPICVLYFVFYGSITCIEPLTQIHCCLGNTSNTVLASQICHAFWE